MNTVWKEGTLPAAWKHAIVPIVKPGIKASHPGSYRPIELTSVLCKVMERMVTDKLVHMCESVGPFSLYQSGLTMDSVLALDCDIKKVLANKLANKEGVVAVFLDVEKAYDMLWKGGLLLKLYAAGVRGRLFNWIQEFLKNRAIQFRVGGANFESVGTENWTRQGSVVGPILFNIMMNNMFQDVGPGFGLSLFADGVLWKRGRNIPFVVQKVQEALGKLLD